MQNPFEDKDSSFSTDWSEDLLNKIKVNDDDYLNFLKEGFDGFYYSKALHVYGLSKKQENHNVHTINSFIKLYFGSLFNDYHAFACDVFGNQFAFTNNGIVLFHIETAEREMIAKTFPDWCEAITNDLNYLTGFSLLKKWGDKYKELDFDERLAPKVPFILGGDYVLSNLYASKFRNVLSFNASIAKQVVKLPEGKRFKIKINPFTPEE